MKKTSLGIGSGPGSDRRPTPVERGFDLDVRTPPSQRAPHARKPELGFGEIDLPSLGAQLPAVAGQLPSVAGQLPVVANQLPSISGQLPAVSNPLPSVASSLPSIANTLPMRSDPPAGLDMQELDLPPSRPNPGGHLFPGAIGPPPGFGELDLGESHSRPPPPTAIERGETKAAGGMAFGEVDLGGGGGGAPAPSTAPGAVPLPLRPAPMERPSLSGSAVEASLPTGGPAPAERGERPASRVKKQSKAPRVVLALLGLVIVGGGAMQLTSYGAFGYLAISDVVHAKDYVKIATETSAKARKRLGPDTYIEARAAMDDLQSARQKSPRAKGLSAYGAGAIFAFEVRFGHDTDRDPRAKQWLAELKDSDAKYLAFAQAAQDASLGDWPKARAGLEKALKRDAGDPIQQDIALLRGEVELGAKDAAAAQTAFKNALALGATPRVHFGLARTAMLAGDYKTAKDEIDVVLGESPTHAGALLLRSDIHWNRDQDEKAAIDDLATALDVKTGASNGDRTQAYARRGWIHAARGRAGDARGDFEQALKLDSRNVAALVGQGEVFYNEGRYTEALSRFETAVQTDTSDVSAIIADAKAKIALERLQDAKTQLSEARLTYARDPRVAYWLGKAEEALGNSTAAEHHYTSAIELSQVGDRDAILPYVALATSLLSHGEGKEAQAKLDEARSKLPDSAALQRALGELAGAQGQYDDAVKYFEAAIERDTQDVSTRFRLGAIYRRMGKMEKAGDQFDLVLASDKDYPGLALERGLLYEQSGDVEKALEQFKNALAKAPDDADLQGRVGAAYVAIQRPDEAIPMLRKVLEKRSHSAEANHYLGRALFLKGQGSEVEAMRFLRRAIELDPHRAEYHLYVGWAANSASPAQLGLARDEIDKALVQDRLLADGYWQLGVLERKEGAVENALKHLRKALELKPTRFEVHASMAECFEDKNDPQTALSEWQKAITSNDKLAIWRYRYGRLLFDRHQSGEASKHLTYAADIAVKEDPKPGWYPNCEFLAAESLRAAGNRNEAKDRYRKFLGIAPMNSPDRRDAIRALRDLGDEWGL